MKRILVYLLMLLAVGVTCGLMLALHPFAESHPDWFLACISLLAGLCGGLVNCLRAVYLNACVHKRWDSEWHVWYYIRPILSTMMGGIAYVFIRAGLIVFGQGSQTVKEWNIYGYLAVCFIAGYNVERFLERVEAISEASFGIKKRVSREEDAKK